MLSQLKLQQRHTSPLSVNLHWAFLMLRPFLLQECTWKARYKRPAIHPSPLPWKVQASDTVTSFSPTAVPSTHGEDIRKRSVVCLRPPHREIASHNGTSPFFSCLKKVSEPPWIHLSDALTKKVLNVLRKEPPPLPSKLPYWPISCIHHASLPDPRRHCCISSPPPPHCYPLLSRATSPVLPPLLLWLISTRLPPVTGPTLKSHQSFLLQQEPQQQQQDSFFVLIGQWKQGHPLLRAWPRTQTSLMRISDSKPIQGWCHPALIPLRDGIPSKMEWRNR